MTKEELDAIASRAPYCRSFGESVSLSRVERDELVALARDGMRYRGLRAALFQQWLSVGEAEIGMRVYGACPTETDIDAAIDAATAKEEA
ncbi:hypothetical protein EUC41_08670 [Achromobacter denitrificans]|uniref:hypothetical protein n=1 Tax=Achromobacter denitrificans TaxID=32002 RepID=UPI00240E0FA4|nr:hypothetical protein [Achromobacter denitrificans]WFC66385.1 hypothetical protein EUC41_08670 [Achromobacter denitrificans]